MCFSQHRRGTLLSVCAFLTFGAIVLIIGGYVSPGWSVSNSDVGGVSSYAHLGIWYGVACDGGTCVTSEIIDAGSGK